jgi:hypothetical protein
MGIVRVIWSSPAMVISLAELAVTEPATFDPSRIVTVACWPLPAGAVPASFLAHEHKPRASAATNISDRVINASGSFYLGPFPPFLVV